MLESLRSEKVDTTRPGPDEIRVRGLDAPRTIVELETAEEEKLAALLIGKDTPQSTNEWFVMAKGGARIEVVQADNLSSIPKSADELIEASN